MLQLEASKLGTKDLFSDLINEVSDYYKSFVKKIHA